MKDQQKSSFAIERNSSGNKHWGWLILCILGLGIPFLFLKYQGSEDSLLKKLHAATSGDWELEQSGELLTIQSTEPMTIYFSDLNAVGDTEAPNTPEKSVAKLVYKLESRWDEKRFELFYNHNDSIRAQQKSLLELYGIPREEQEKNTRKKNIVSYDDLPPTYQETYKKLETQKQPKPAFHSEKYTLIPFSCSWEKEDDKSVYLPVISPQTEEDKIYALEDLLKEILDPI